MLYAEALIIVLGVGFRVPLCVFLIAISAWTKPRLWFFIYLVFRSVKTFFVGIF